MERIIALVEGHTETHFINAAYGNAIVQRPIANGKDVGLDVIAEAIVEHLNTISGSISRVVILLDREGRQMSAKEMRDEILKRLEPSKGGRTIYLGVSDRQIENWIVADQNSMRARFSDSNYTYPGDGCSGKHLLKGLAGADASPRDKAVWLKATQASASRQRSTSLEDFLAQIDFYWPWAAA